MSDLDSPPAGKHCNPRSVISCAFVSGSHIMAHHPVGQTGHGVTCTLTSIILRFDQTIGICESVCRSSERGQLMASVIESGQVARVGQVGADKFENFGWK